MLSARFERKKKIKNWTTLLNKVNEQFLPRAALDVEAEAVRRVPVDRGGLKGSISSRVDGDQAIIGTNLEYAEAVEYGSRPHTINSPVKIKGVGWRYIKTHPGTTAQPYLRPAIDKLKKPLIRLYKQIFRSVYGR